MINKVLCFGALFISCGQAMGADWVLVAKAENKTALFYVDKASVQNVRLDNDYSNFNPDKIYVSAFVQPTYLKGNVVRDKEGISYSKELWYFSCFNKRYIVDGSIDYGIKNQFIGSWRSNKSGYLANDWEVAYPDTLSENVLEAACYFNEQRSAAEKVADAAANAAAAEADTKIESNEAEHQPLRFR